MDYKVDFVTDYFLGQTAGNAAVVDFERLLDEMLTHPKWQPGMAWIHDHTDLDAGVLTVYEVKEIADLCAERRAQLGAGRCAIVVGRDLEFGLTRMWAAYVEDRWDVNPGIFRSTDDAIAWVSA